MSRQRFRKYRRWFLEFLLILCVIHIWLDLQWSHGCLDAGYSNPRIGYRSGVPSLQTYSSLPWLPTLQRLLNCTSAQECFQQADHKLSPSTLQVLDTIQRQLNCHNTQQCLQILQKNSFTKNTMALLPTIGNNDTNNEELIYTQLKHAADQEILERHVRHAWERGQRAEDYRTPVPFVDYHPAFVPLLSPLQPLPEWTDVNIPDLNVVGLGKAGTTHLYGLLQSHPRVTNYTYDKETCLLPFTPTPFWELLQTNTTSATTTDATATLSYNDTSSKSINQKRYMAQYNMHRVHADVYHQQLAKRIPSQQKTVNGCLRFEKLETSVWYLRSMAYNNNKNMTVPPTAHHNNNENNNNMKTHKKKQFFFLFRDPADWLWAVHNFWKDTTLDRNAEHVRFWADESVDYRSPELFHELVASGSRTLAGHHLLQFRTWTVDYPRRLLAMARMLYDDPSSITTTSHCINDTVLFLRNEDMLPSVISQPGGALERIRDFTGLPIHGFSHRFTTHIFNCNNHKGIDNVECGSRPTSAYRIAGNRSMLPETRRLIYLHMWEECKIWAREFGIVYPDCLNVMEPFSSSHAS
jgi:hypothetical protein